ncbi:diguanylate cyclase (GGDEF)-like protein [Caldicoprobacter guelmensis]|uniref:diguanylate cyclase n=1 Tax=Caldicoprobacter guelmensis TaxID=1170224 RepID=UPI001958A86C|nr:diguanylate cyclase (GGDEF)-like protein [Caldicoprobacter guelmensis]
MELRKKKINNATAFIVLILADLSLWFIIPLMDKGYILNYSLIWIFVVVIQVTGKAFFGVWVYKLYKEAYTDILTGLYNRRYFYKRLPNAIMKIPFSLLLIDIDNFKSVNDAYGHVVGDFVLQQFADILRSRARKDDIIARWGGEEFVMALPQTGVDEAFRIADVIRRAVEEHCFCYEGVTCNITVSIGIASIDGKANIDDIEQFFVTADKALYKAKEKRNCITVSKI